MKTDAFFMRIGSAGLGLMLSLCLSLCLGKIAAGAGVPPEARWVYLQSNLQVRENVDKAIVLMGEAAKLGYNGIVLADYKLNILDRVPDHYFANVRTFRAEAARLHLEIIPAVASFGYSEGILTYNPNLAEGLPVKGAELVVRKGEARIDAVTGASLLKGGDCETTRTGREHELAGWSFQDNPGRTSVVDRSVFSEGKGSLRFRNLRETNPESGNGRISQSVKVQPYREYRVSVRFKTDAYERASDLRGFAMGADGGILSYSNLGVKTDQDWTLHHFVFNSLDNTEVRIYLGGWSGTTGTFWIDDVRMEEVPFLNLLRRDGCPLVVKTSEGQTLKEGRDYAPLHDPKMGLGGAYTLDHAPPTLVLKKNPDHPVADGTKLRVDYFHAMTIHDGQTPCCLDQDEVFQIVAKQIRLVEKTFQPKRYMLSHDEIRIANWCDSCRKGKRTAGALLAANVRKCRDLVRAVNPKAEIAVWSDMFDPAHNALSKPYYLVRDSLEGSWKGLDPDFIVINWNSGAPRKSLPFFAARGHRQVLAGFYDGDPKDIATWLNAGKDQKGIIGVMYTTWQNNFRSLAPFAAAAKFPLIGKKE